MKYLKNLVSSRVYDLETFPDRTRPAADKRTFRGILQKPDTDWILYSLVEGEDPGLRISRDNHPRRISGLIADFEPNDPGRDCYDLATLGRASWVKPTLALPSQSGGIHAVWKFDRPIEVDETIIGPALQVIAREVGILGARKPKQLFRLLRLDEAALADPCKYYTWSDKQPIPIGEVLESSRFADQIWQEVIKPRDPVLRVPLPLAYEALCEKYPKIKGRAWDVGERVNIFWDGGENTSAGIIDADGIYSFRDNQFFSWKHPDLLGPAKVKEIGEGGVNRILSESYFDGKRFWNPDDETRWQWSEEKMFVRRLTYKYGIADKATQNQILSAIDTTRRIHGGAPLVHRAPGIHLIEGEKVLNTSTLRPLAMAEGDPSVVTKYLQDLMVERAQYDWFCWWLASAYRAAIDQKEQQGPLLALAGPPGVGKTYVSNKVFGALLGGFCDATDVLFRNSKFTSHVLKFFAWVADDPPPASYREQGSIENVLKSYVANRVHKFEAKGLPAVSTPWAGRIMITCNLDAASTFALPSLDQSNKDKVAFLRMRTPLGGIPSEADLKAAMPAFAHYLYHLEIPKEWQDRRFGVRAYHDKSVLEQSEENSQCSLALEFLRVFLPSELQEGQTEFRASASGMVTAARNGLSGADVLLPGSSGARWLGVRLSELMSKGYPIKRTRSKGITYWRISSEILNDDVKTSAVLDTDVTKISG